MRRILMAVLAAAVAAGLMLAVAGCNAGCPKGQHLQETYIGTINNTPQYMSQCMPN